MAYLDHAATTPMLPEAVEAYVAAAGHVGNASSLHAQGRHARRHVEEARERIAASLGARPSEVIFTGGGTESDNLAVKGIYWSRREADPRATGSWPRRPNITPYWTRCTGWAGPRGRR
jgi:cysteine desulfurase